MSFEGEFCHPYIDRQIEIPEVAEAVNKLIEEEIERSPKPEFIKYKIPKPQILQIVEIPKDDKARLQDLYHQEAVCNVISRRQGEFWESELTAQEQYINLLKMQEKQLEQDIFMIHKRRFELQQKAIPQIESAREKETFLLQSIAHMEEELAKLSGN